MNSSELRTSRLVDGAWAWAPVLTARGFAAAAAAEAAPAPAALALSAGIGGTAWALFRRLPGDMVAVRGLELGFCFFFPLCVGGRGGRDGTVFFYLRCLVGVPKSGCWFWGEPSSMISLFSFFLKKEKKMTQMCNNSVLQIGLLPPRQLLHDGRRPLLPRPHVLPEALLGQNLFEISNQLNFRFLFGKNHSLLPPRRRRPALP